MRARDYAAVVGVAGVVSLGMVPLTAQSVPSQPRPNPEVQRRQQLAMQALAKTAMKPKVECGMKIVPADPRVDPKAIKPVPDQATKPTIRQVAPGACR
jgi:hypothetical protein